MADTSGLNAVSLALTSGLFGAAITAILNYFINIKLINRTHKIREQQTAYVYLVSLSGMVETPRL